MTGNLQFKRGLKTNLPTSAPSGMPLWCEDSKELYIGTGSSIQKIGSDPEQSTGGTQTETITLVQFITSGNSWCKIYSNKWCEQGGISTVNANANTSTKLTISFIKTFTTNKYTAKLTSSVGPNAYGGTTENAISYTTKNKNSIAVSLAACYNSATGKTAAVSVDWEAKGFIA